MADTKNRGLGTSFGSLIPKQFDSSLLTDDNEKVQKIAVSALEPNAAQPRQHFDETALNELAASITQYGILQPLVAVPGKGGHYTLIAGERRWRAAKAAGLTHVPVLVRTSKELEQLEIALIENVQRVDLSPLEQAASIYKLHEQFNVSYEAIAKRLGKATSTIVNIVRLMQLPDDAQQALQDNKISEGHARQILALKDDPKGQLYLLAQIMKHEWTVRQAERYVTSVKEGVKEAKQAHERVQSETPATRALSKRLGTTVMVKRMAHGGRLEITFRDDEHLSKLLESLDK